MFSYYRVVAALVGCIALIVGGTSHADNDEDPGGWERVPSAGASVQTDASPTAVASSSSPPWAAGHPDRGPADAPVTIVEFADFQCPFCRGAEPTVARILAAYGNNVRRVHMDFPLPIHAAAMGAALAARCADEQGQFWPYHDALYASQGDLTADRFKSIAHTLGLSSPSFAECFDTQRFASEIASDRSIGERIGVNGTPTFVINHKAIAGAVSFAQFRAIIDEELRQSKR
ncbi:MAG: DsbA family protein [Candidatus Binataceae bacterium]